MGQRAFFLREFSTHVLSMTHSGWDTRVGVGKEQEGGVDHEGQPPFTGDPPLMAGKA